MKKLCGIDEAGRGALAGPLTMAGVVLERPIEGLNDSKKLTTSRREKLYEEIVRHSQWHLVHFDATQIDEEGLSQCLSQGLQTIMQALEADTYLYDGPTTFGVTGLSCQIKADLTVAEVSAASIIAKVSRDRIMLDMATRYSVWGFEKHKGYGTKEHVEAIRTHGYSPIHRRSFQIRALRHPPLF